MGQKSNRNSGKMIIFEKILWLSKTSLARRGTFEVILIFGIRF